MSLTVSCCSGNKNISYVIIEALTPSEETLLKDLNLQFMWPDKVTFAALLTRKYPQMYISLQIS